MLTALLSIDCGIKVILIKGYRTKSVAVNADGTS